MNSPGYRDYRPRDWHVFVVAFAAAGRRDLLVPAAVGAQFFWVTVLVLLRRVLCRT